MKNILRILYISVFIPLLSACSTSNTSDPNNTVKEVQIGVVQAVNNRVIQPKKHQPNANVGVSVGSGGRAGVYGSMDVATIGRLLSGPAKPKVMHEIIIKRDNGELIAVTQLATKVSFKRGDRVKIVQRDGKAQVIH